MPKQQSKRRRKRYNPGSSYAGHVRPTGVLGFLSSAKVMRIVFISMALALMAGGGAALFGSGTFSGGGGQSGGNFVVEDEPGLQDPPSATAEPGATEEAPGFVNVPDMIIDPGKTYIATITTNEGQFQVLLFADQAPTTVNNFVFLAQEGFYDGIAFSFVEPGFSAQTGEPGTGDSPSYDLPQEGLGEYAKGTLGMASASEFFIALSDSDADVRQFQDFTSFGQITSGLDIAELLTIGAQIQTIEISES